MLEKRWCILSMALGMYLFFHCLAKSVAYVDAASRQEEMWNCMDTNQREKWLLCRQELGELYNKIKCDTVGSERIKLQLQAIKADQRVWEDQEEDRVCTELRKRGRVGSLLVLRWRLARRTLALRALLGDWCLSKEEHKKQSDLARARLQAHQEMNPITSGVDGFNKTGADDDSQRT
jgi:hypothetical protein